MTLTAINVLSFGAVGDAFGAWCRRFAVKELMDLFGVAEQTAKKWRAGKIAEPKHLVMMVERWGEGFLLSIFAPALDRLELGDLARDLELIETKVALIRERIVHESKRSQGLCLSARLAVLGPDDAVAARPVVGELDQRSGGGLARPGRGAAGPRRRAAGLAAALLILLAACQPLAADLGLIFAHQGGGTVADLDDNGALLRVRVRSVRVRVKSRETA